MNPVHSDLHVNVPLTNISVAFVQRTDHFVASTVFPVIPSQHQSDTWWSYDRGEWNRGEMKDRGAATESEGAGWTVTEESPFYCRLKALHHDIDDQRRRNADTVFNLDREATIFVTQQYLIEREVRWATNFFAGGVWTNDWDGVSAAPGANQVLQWNDAASNPIEDVRNAKRIVLESTGFEPNTLVLGKAVYDKLVDHPDIIDRLKYGQTGPNPAMANREKLAQLFEVDRIIVSKAIRNTAKKGQANSHSFVLGKKALLCYVPPEPGLYTPAAGYTFAWTGYMGATRDGFRITSFRMEHLKSDRIEIEAAYDMKKVSADLGFFWDTIVA